jgi:hypothetical protein
VPFGHIDSVTSSGLVEGWGYDEQRPGQPLLIGVLDAADAEIAAGLANLYRRDLAEARHAYGWCHFRLRLTPDVSDVRDKPLKLVAKISRSVLFGPQTVGYIETPEYAVASVAEIVAVDPTTLASLDQIDGCDDIFDDYIKARGVESFVRAAYVYVLGRSIDAEGLVLYNRLLRQKRMTPYAMLRTLADSAEFRSRPRSLMAPTSQGFPFRIAT